MQVLSTVVNDLRKAGYSQAAFKLLLANTPQNFEEITEMSRALKITGRNTEDSIAFKHAGGEFLLGSRNAQYVRAGLLQFLSEVLFRLLVSLVHENLTFTHI